MTTCIMRTLLSFVSIHYTGVISTAGIKFLTFAATYTALRIHILHYALFKVSDETSLLKI